MSRYSGHDIGPVLAAAEQWRDRCWLHDGSLFTDEQIWTEASANELYRYFVENPDSGDRSFFDKLEDQLSPAPSIVKKLAGEMFWVLFLFQLHKSMKAETKRSAIRKVWQWSGDELSAEHPLLNAPLELGVGHPGTAYQTRRWAELKYFIELTRHFKSLSDDERSRLLGDPLRFAEWTDQYDHGAEPQFRHVLRYLLFPDSFEPIATGRHKRQIISAFRDIPLREVRKMSFVELDHELLNIREEQEEKYQTKDLSFYLPPLKEIWAEEGKKSNNQPRLWIEKTIVKGRPDRESGEHALGQALWSPQKGRDGRNIYRAMRQVKPGDVILHLTDNEGISGVSIAAESADDSFVGLAGTDWQGQEAYRIQLKDFQPVEPLLHRSAFLGNPTYQDALRSIAASHKNIFYARNLELNQGAYLTEAPQELARLLDDAGYGETGRHLPHLKIIERVEEPKQNYEGSRLMSNRDIPLNLIYYGPPGTGKTYQSIETAVRICDGEAPNDRNSIVRRYKQLEDDQRIAFVTFHQSYSYEDFVEGIRPVLMGDESTVEGASSEGVRYECRPGIFKIACALAKKVPVGTRVRYGFDENKNRVWKMSLGNTLLDSGAAIYDECIEKGQILLGYGKGLDFSGCDDKDAVIEHLRSVKPEITNNDYNITSIHYFKNMMQAGDLVIVSDGNLKFRAIGKVSGDYQYVKSNEYQQMRPVEWLVTYEEGQPYEKALRKKFSQMTLYHLSKKVLRLDVLHELLSGDHYEEPPNHVLIIDEINRGNISKIFGELISLVEPDKRLGNGNELTSVLPYSSERFGVPNNLYILGTMNTADRSIALLDTALRRRFDFEELIPNASLVSGSDGSGRVSDGESGTIDLRALLKAMNQRIQFLINRDQMIGHAYLMGVTSFQELQRVMSQQIIPLLQEYFYEDWHRIQLVFQDITADGEKNEPQIVRHERVRELDVLGYDHDDYEDGYEYSVTPERKITPKAIRKIYER